MYRSLLAFGMAIFTFAVCGQPAPAAAEGPKVLSEKTVKGFPFPESVGYDATNKVLYVSQFVSALKPTEKDGAGRISKVSLDGKVIEQHFLPGPGEKLNKPKGIWVSGDHLWVTDIDVVWEFNTKTKKGRKVALPDIKFANDPTVVDNVLYVSDNRGDALYRVDPANFLDGAEPKVTKAFVGQEVNPNGLYPSQNNNAVLMVGFLSDKVARGIFEIQPGGMPKKMSRPIGRLDGLYRMDDNSLLVTDWNSGSLFHWAGDNYVTTLAKGFKGPADFCVIPGDKSMTVVVPDLVKSELRFVQISK